MTENYGGGDGSVLGRAINNGLEWIKADCLERTVFTIILALLRGKAESKAGEEGAAKHGSMGT